MNSYVFAVHRAAAEIRRARRWERDRMSRGQLADVEALLEQLDSFTRRRLPPWGTRWFFSMFTWKPRDPAVRERGESLIASAEALYRKVFPKRAQAVIAENVDVIIVALALAIGIRTFFIQPFKIPTNSMYPTLRGVVITPDVEKPGWLARFTDTWLFGRTYLDFDVPPGAQLAFQGIQVKGFWLFRTLHFPFVDPQGQVTVLKVWTDGEVRDFVMDLNLTRRGPFRIQAQVDTGDHLFVNKMAYHFRKPSRGESFVFRTEGLLINNGTRPRTAAQGSQFYIKRLVGVPGDTLAVVPPQLWVNGAPAESPQIQRVWSNAEGYNGYSHGPRGGGVMNFLRNPADTVSLKGEEYWAMGDNSYSSQDSRQFGPVPLENVVGDAFLIYYPFNRSLRWID